MDTPITTDWEVLFRCMSDNTLFDDEMPESPIDLLGVHWAVEIAGPGAAVWGSVHQMTITAASSIWALPGASDESTKALSSSRIPADWRDPVTTGEIRTRFWESCRTDPTCWKYNADRASGRSYRIDYASGRFHTDGVARDLAPVSKMPTTLNH
jgi:hypothetical protein